MFAHTKFQTRFFFLLSPVLIVFKTFHQSFFLTFCLSTHVAQIVFKRALWFLGMPFFGM